MTCIREQGNVTPTPSPGRPIVDTYFVIREFKHDVYGRRQTAKVTSDFLSFSCNP